ncbi:hypothetical protein AK812_SmicGene40411 [Symbiodinium microadriaticum]|uniref:Uncharacterized protein n=1 Tax=Symbiodinium microadriaticum TaxID=2951 RepID=A0A1Q9C8P2_SYMMI|nr:hypothetical protein AK812_SmicGene40411 [Symbiodinium microadriaticum]
MPCRTAIAVSDRVSQPDSRSIDVLVDARPVCAAWFTVSLLGRWTTTSAIVEECQTRLPEEEDLWINNRAPNQRLIRVAAGQVFEVSVGPLAFRDTTGANAPVAAGSAETADTGGTGAGTASSLGQAAVFVNGGGVSHVGIGGDRDDPEIDPDEETPHNPHSGTATNSQYVDGIFLIFGQNVSPEMIEVLIRRPTMMFLWATSHGQSLMMSMCCIGNELADLAAKSAAEGHLLGDISWTVPQEQDDAGCFLHSVLRKCNLWAPATWDYVQQGPTWTYAQRRNGALNRPEFVLLPQEWQQGNVSSWTDASITAANMVIDHLATVVDVCITLYVGPGPQRTARIAIDVKALTDPANRTDLAQIIEDAPRPSWQVSAHSHVAQVTAYLQKSLSERFPRVRQAPVHPYLSDMAWDLHQQVSRLRRRLTAVKTAVRRQTFAGILEAWRCVARSKADRAQYLEKLADDIQDTAPQLQLGGRKGGSVIVGSHVMRTYMRIRKAQNRPSSVLFADVSAAYYSTVRCLAARRPSEEPSGDALEATLARMDPLSAEDQLEVPSAMAQQGADPWLRALTCVKNSDTWMVLRSGDVAVKTHRGTRPGSAWADLTFGVLVRRILRVRDGCRRARTGTSSSAQVSWDGRRHWGPAEEETHIVSLEDIVWADDVASCLDTVDAAGTASHVGFEDCEAWYDFMRLHPVPSWFRVEVADAPAGRKEVADDVLLMLDPELICARPTVSQPSE